MNPILPIAGVPDELLRVLNERLRDLEARIVQPAAAAAPISKAATAPVPPELLSPPAVLGALNLTHPGAIPKVSAMSTLTESAVTDNGAQVAIASRSLTVANSATPATITRQSPGNGANANVLLLARDNATGGAPTPGDLIGLLWQEKDSAGNTVTVARLSPGMTAVAAGAVKCCLIVYVNEAEAMRINDLRYLGVLNNNPQYPLDVTGDANLTGVLRIGGTQVVRSRQAAVTAPSGGGTAVTAPFGGGTSISAPSGGTTIDSEARAAINSLMFAVSSSGNTVDPGARTAIGSIISAIASSGNCVDPAARTAINAIRAALTAHGLTA